MRVNKSINFFNTVKICLDVDLMLSIIYQQFNFLSIPNIDWASSQFWFVSTVDKAKNQKIELFSKEWYKNVFEIVT